MFEKILWLGFWKWWDGILYPFKTFKDTGFPQELLDELSKKTGHKIVGNKSANGTVIFDD